MLLAGWAFLFLKLKLKPHHSSLLHLRSPPLWLATASFYYVHRRRLRDEDKGWDAWYLLRFGALLRDHERGERESK